MFEDDEDVELTPRKPEQSRLPWWTAAIGAGVVVLAGMTYFQSVEVNSLRQDVTQLGLNQSKENAALRAIFAQSDHELQSILREFRTELASTREQASESAKQAQVAAARRAEAIAGQIETRQASRAKLFTEELAKVRESHNEASSKISSISTEVGEVKSEVESAKSSIQQAHTELQRVRGDMGLMSGLVATNSKEIQILRDLGDRDIFEFTLAKNAGLQQVGDVRMVLKKADTGRNRYTIELLSDDKRVEKKDRSMNEPVQFYVSSRASKQPYELVVNEVKKNMIVGYLARPKMVLAQGRAK